MAPVNEPVLMEGMRLIFRNFSGKEGPYNREGDRNFCVILDDDVADAMARDGWNVKRTKPRPGDEEEGTQAYLSVRVNYGKGRPPKIVLITSRGRTNLGEDEVELLDWADIETADLYVRPYEWAVRGDTGISAYLSSLYVTIREDYLDMKYSDLNQVPIRGGRVDE